MASRDQPVGETNLREASPATVRRVQTADMVFENTEYFSLVSIQSCATGCGSIGHIGDIQNMSLHRAMFHKMSLQRWLPVTDDAW